jgi:Tfp pilus assembly protein PilV
MRAALADGGRDPRQRSRSGMSLVEVAIALGILGFGLLAAIAAHVAAVRFNGESQLRTEAAYLAEQQLEAFQAMDAGAVEVLRTDAGYPNDPANPIDPDPGDAAARQFARSWTITPDSPENGVYSISVAVSWSDRLGNTRSVTLSSIKTDR